MAKGKRFGSFFSFGLAIGLAMALFVTMMPQEAAG